MIVGTGDKTAKIGLESVDTSGSLETGGETGDALHIGEQEMVGAVVG